MGPQSYIWRSTYLQSSVFLRISYGIYLTKVIVKTFLKIIFLYFMVLKSVLFDHVVLEILLSRFQEQA